MRVCFKRLWLVVNSRWLGLASFDEPEVVKHIVDSLLEAGIECVEITLRSENALTVLKHVVEAFPNTSVGAGTVKSAEDFNRIIEAGAKFAVSPGATPYLLAEASRWDLCRTCQPQQP